MDTELPTFLLGAIIALIISLPFTAFDDTVPIYLVRHGEAVCESNDGLRFLQRNSLFGKNGKIYCFNGAEFNVPESQMIELRKVADE